MIIILVLLDQIIKYFAYINKPDFNILGEFFGIHYIENTGTIFGLFSNSNTIFMWLALALCIIISIYSYKKMEKNSLEQKTIRVVLAGGIGNLIDRIVRGFVVDFISLKYIGIFNFADMYIVLGVIFIAFLECRAILQEHSKKTK